MSANPTPSSPPRPTCCATAGDQPARFTAIIADYDGAPAGFALYFTTYSTWRGHHGIRLEDLYVTPSLRGHGIGKALLARLARIAVDQGCPRLEWDVLEWNESAIAFYHRVGAKMLTEWRIMRVADEALAALASEDVDSRTSAEARILSSDEEEFM